MSCISLRFYTAGDAYSEKKLKKTSEKTKLNFQTEKQPGFYIGFLNQWSDVFDLRRVNNTKNA